MGCEWQELSLQEAGVQLIDCDHRTPPASADGFPYIAIPQLKDGRIDLEGVRRISTADFEDWTRKLRPRAHDVIVVRRCNSGESAVVPEGLDCAIGQNLVVLRSTEASRVAPAYLRWLVRGPAWWAEVSTYLNVGAVFDSLKCRDIPMFRLPIPPVAEQESIAMFLDAIDSRINNLRATNATLEAITQALFKSWFVDFDPVHAKAEGRAPEGMDAATAALFPSEFEDSELGTVPKGWRASTLGDEVKTALGGTPSRADDTLWGGDVPWINSGKANEFRVIEPSEYITAKGLMSSSTKLLPARTTIIAITGATLGQVSLTEIATCANQSIVGVLANETLPGEYIYLWVQAHVDDLIARQTGGAQQHVNKDDVNNLPVVCPTSEVLDAFLVVIKPTFDKIANDCFASRTLAAIRDTLLPRLISGKLRLRGGEQLAEVIA